MKNEEKAKQDDRKLIPTVSRVLPNGDLIELVYDRRAGSTAFAVSSGSGIAIERSIDFGGTRLVPWSAQNNLIKQEAVLLPERADEFGSVGDLISDIDAYLYRYVDLSESFRRIAAYYILLTWVYDAFNELPYLRLRGEYGSGKT